MTYGHVLIGPPASGKSTFAHTLAAQLSDAVVVSTDRIREELFGDEAIQGPWSEIEAAVFRQMAAALQAGQTVIYDATNARRPYRLDLLEKLQHRFPNLDWLGWHLTTPLDTCQCWNQQRERLVPETVIEEMYRALKQFPPVPGEGFIRVFPLKPDPDEKLAAQITPILAKLHLSIARSGNRTSQARQTLHRYSRLVDFERLLYLLAHLLHLRNLEHPYSRPSEEKDGLTEVSRPDEARDPVVIIAAEIGQQVGTCYARPEALRRDLEWLEEQEFLQPQVTPQRNKLRLPNLEPDEPAPRQVHSWADRDTCDRILREIRWLAQNPCAQNAPGPKTEQLAKQLIEAGILKPPLKSATSQLRKDIQEILKPYGFLQEHRLRQGYHVGMALLGQQELATLHHTLISHSENLRDPLLNPILERLTQRLKEVGADVDDFYPVQAISNSPIVDSELVPKECLAHSKQRQRLEQAILDGEMLVLNKYTDAATFTPPSKDQYGRSEELRLWPLQIVFHNIAWYLGYELAHGEKRGLMGYERLDRLFEGPRSREQRSRNQQLQALQRINQLRSSSAGLLLGKSVQDQKAWLGTDPQRRAAVTTKVSLWFTPKTYLFIAEGSLRFPGEQVRMHRPAEWGRHRTLPRGRNPYSLKPTPARKLPSQAHPYCMQVDLPRWALEDIDFRRWVIGFGHHVFIEAPLSLRETVLDHARQALTVYD